MVHFVSTKGNLNVISILNHLYDSLVSLINNFEFQFWLIHLGLEWFFWVYIFLFLLFRYNRNEIEHLLQILNKY